MDFTFCGASSSSSTGLGQRPQAPRQRVARSKINIVLVAGGILGYAVHLRPHLLFATLTETHSDCSGGWRTSETEAPKWLQERNGLRQFSDIPIFEADDVPQYVMDDRSWRDRPFIIRQNLNLLERQKVLEKDALMKDALGSKRLISTGYSWTISKNRGEGTTKVPLADFLHHGMYEALTDGDVTLEPAYAFDREEPLWGMPSADDIHPVIRAWNTSAFHVPASAISIQMLGSLGSAVGWHSHGATVQMNIYGRKRWFLYPPDKYPPGDGPGGCFSLTDWIQIIYPTLKQAHKPIECVLEAGDMIFVPDGWYHAVINLADSVALSVQSIHMEPDHQEYFKGVSLRQVQQLSVEDPATVKVIEEKARAYLSQGLMNDLHARRVLFYCLFEKDRREAIRVILEGSDRDPFHVPLQFELASLLVQQLRSGDEVALEEFRAVMKRWDRHLKLNVRNQKALWILSKYERAIGNEEAADRYHERLVKLNAEGIDR